MDARAIADGRRFRLTRDGPACEPTAIWELFFRYARNYSCISCIHHISVNKGLSGAALFGDFFLLLRKRHSRTYSQINYGALKELVREKLTRKGLVFKKTWPRPKINYHQFPWPHNAVTGRRHVARGSFLHRTHDLQVAIARDDRKSPGRGAPDLSNDRVHS